MWNIKTAMLKTCFVRHTRGMGEQISIHTRIGISHGPSPLKARTGDGKKFCVPLLKFIAIVCIMLQLKQYENGLRRTMQRKFMNKIVYMLLLLIQPWAGAHLLAHHTISGARTIERAPATMFERRMFNIRLECWQESIIHLYGTYK